MTLGAAFTGSAILWNKVLFLTGGDDSLGFVCALGWLGWVFGWAGWTFDGAGLETILTSSFTIVLYYLTTLVYTTFFSTDLFFSVGLVSAGFFLGAPPNNKSSRPLLKLVFFWWMTTLNYGYLAPNLNI